MPRNLTHNRRIPHVYARRPNTHRLHPLQITHNTCTSHTMARVCCFLSIFLFFFFFFCKCVRALRSPVLNTGSLAFPSTACFPGWEYIARPWVPSSDRTTLPLSSLSVIFRPTVVLVMKCRCRQSVYLLVLSTRNKVDKGIFLGLQQDP